MTKNRRAMRAAIIVELLRETLELPDDFEISWQQIANEFHKLMEETYVPPEELNEARKPPTPEYVKQKRKRELINKQNQQKNETLKN